MLEVRERPVEGLRHPQHLPRGAGAAHQAVVAAQREREAEVAEPIHGVVGELGRDAGLQVGAGAHLEADLPSMHALGDGAELGALDVAACDVLDQAHAVADPFGAAVQGVGDRGGPVGLPGMDRHPHARRTRRLELGTEPGGGEALLRSGEVQSHHTGVAAGDGDLHQVIGGVEMAQVAQQLTHHDPLPGGLRRGDALVEPVLDGLDRLVQAQPAAGVLVRGPPGLGVHDSVGHHVLHELAGDPAQLRSCLHQRHGALEGGEVGGKGAGVGGGVEPVGDGLGVRRLRLVAGGGAGHFEAELAAQLEHGLRTQPAVEVIVQGDLGQGADESRGEIHRCRIRRDDDRWQLRRWRGWRRRPARCRARAPRSRSCSR